MRHATLAAYPLEEKHSSSNFPLLKLWLTDMYTDAHTKSTDNDANYTQCTNHRLITLALLVLYQTCKNIMGQL